MTSFTRTYIACVIVLILLTIALFLIGNPPRFTNCVYDVSKREFLCVGRFNYFTCSPGNDTKMFMGANTHGHCEYQTL
jgi:hypothetical protein